MMQTNLANIVLRESGCSQKATSSDSLHMKRPQQSLHRREADSWFPGVGASGLGVGGTANGYRVSSGVLN